jgi:acyl carrier protein
VTSAEKLGWEEFANAIALAGKLPAENVRQDQRLLEDLGLDSLGLLEVIVFLVVDCGMEALADELPERDWRGVSAGELYREYREGVPPPRREEFTTRLRPS